MQNKGIVICVAVLLTLASIFYLVYLNELQKFHCHYSRAFVPLFDLW